MPKPLTENVSVASRKVNPSIVPVILSGGAGSRLWPLSRENHPKQLIRLLGESTLLQATIQRLAALDCVRAPIVVCNDEHSFLVAQQLEAIEVEPSAILLEPAARNTAPAIAAAAFEALAQSGKDESPILLVLPADHVIRTEILFAGAVRNAVREARTGKLVTFGVTPTRPETGYGYIKAGLPSETENEALSVDEFVEKPDIARAAAWVEEGGYFWNSGMFVFGAHEYLQELGVHSPSIGDAVKAAHQRATKDLEFVRLHAGSFTESPAVSVDHAIMEHTSNAVVVPLDAGWSDIGSWTGLSELLVRDNSGNTTQGDVVLEATRDTSIFAGSRMVAAVGMKDCVIVDTADAVLVAGKGADQHVKNVVERLKGEGRDECRVHRKVYRPWGHYDVVHSGEGFKIKLIVVNPGQMLSLQMHHHRAEHWTVVRGTARVIRGDEAFIVSENQSTYIPPRVKHRLENPETLPLELVEVQSGPYLGEDDIVRFEDAYGRVEPHSHPE